jgi:hypothetical protein
MTPSIDKLVMNDIQQSLDELELDMKSTIQEEDGMKLSTKSTKKKNKKLKARQKLGRNNVRLVARRLSVLALYLY